MKKIDLTGMRFGKLTVLREAKRKSNERHRKWLCRCDCGNEVVVLGCNLQKGNTKTCGCSHKKHKYGEISTKHMRLYRTYYAMKQRCYNEHSKIFNHYGGRGITICDEWLSSFEAFRDWALKTGYADNLTIERIDVNGNYCPENCCWITQAEQLNNTRRNVILTYDGLTMNLTQWAKHLGVNRDFLRGRIRLGWDCERVFTEPNHTQFRGGKTKNE